MSVMAGDKASKLKLYEKVILMLKQLELNLLTRGTYRETNTKLSQGFAVIP
jgi:hypothetical protein